MIRVKPLLIDGNNTVDALSEWAASTAPSVQCIRTVHCGHYQNHTLWELSEPYTVGTIRTVHCGLSITQCKWSFCGPQTPLIRARCIKESWRGKEAQCDGAIPGVNEHADRSKQFLVSTLVALKCGRRWSTFQHFKASISLHASKRSGQRSLYLLHTNVSLPPLYPFRAMSNQRPHNMWAPRFIFWGVCHKTTFDPLERSSHKASGPVCNGCFRIMTPLPA